MGLGLPYAAPVSLSLPDGREPGIFTSCADRCFVCEAGEEHGQERWGDSAGRTILRQGGVRADCTDLEADALMKARAE